MSVTTMPTTEQAAAGADAPKKSKKKLLLVAVVLLAVVGAAGYWFLLRTPAAEQEPEPGEVIALEPIQINLAGGHYLRIGLALQASAEVSEPLDGSKALDSAIELFTGLPMDRLSQPVQRNRLKEELVAELDERYEGEVLDVYFTDFVTQ